MRPLFRQRWGDEVADRLFGRSEPPRDEDRSAGRIRVSHLYKVPGHDSWCLKVWGDAPPGIWDNVEGHPKLHEVVQTVDEFIRGGKGMFPGSQSIDECEFKPEEFWG